MATFFQSEQRIWKYTSTHTHTLAKAVYLTFFALEICWTYSIAGLRRWIFFDIKTFIGGRPLFWIFKPIESETELQQRYSLPARV